MSALHTIGVVKSLCIDTYPIFAFLRCETEIESVFIVVTRILRWMLARASKKEMRLVRSRRYFQHIDGDDTFGVARSCVDVDGRSVYPVGGVVKMMKGRMRGLCGVPLGQGIYKRSMTKIRLWKCIFGTNLSTDEDIAEITEACSTSIASSAIVGKNVRIPDDIYGIYVSLGDTIGDMATDMVMTLIPHPDAMYISHMESGFSVAYETSQVKDIHPSDLIIKDISKMKRVFKTDDISSIYFKLINNPDKLFETFLIANEINPSKYILLKDLKSPFRNTYVFLLFLSHHGFVCPLLDDYGHVDVANVMEMLGIPSSCVSFDDVCKELCKDIGCIFMSIIPALMNISDISMDLFSMVQSIIQKKCLLVYKVFSMCNVFPMDKVHTLVEP